MIIRQEEDSPIGNYFHDNGIQKTFEKIQTMADDFEIDTERLRIYCGELSSKLKQFRSFILSAEKSEMKKSVRNEISNFLEK